MNQLELSNSYVEVLEILKYAPIEIRFKIPYRIKRILKEKASTTYKWKYDKKKRLLEQNCLETTKEVLGYIFEKYISEDKENVIKTANIKIEAFEDLFKHNKKATDAKIEEKQQELIVVEKEIFIERIIKKIKSFFTRK